MENANSAVDFVSLFRSFSTDLQPYSSAALPRCPSMWTSYRDVTQAYFASSRTVETYVRKLYFFRSSWSQ